MATVNATHLRAGQITAQRVGCTREFIITIEVFTNTRSPVLFGGEQDFLDFGDGSRPIKVPEIPNIIRLDLDPDGAVATASYTIRYTYAGPGEFIISYREPNRNAGVVNMDGSVNTTFYLETKIIIDPFFGCNSTPILSVPPIDQACPGVAWFHNPGAYDPNPEDSLSYQMVIPFSDRNTQVVNYRDPNNPQFYTNPNIGNESGTGRATFAIDPVTGTISWDAPGSTGEYNIAFHVIEWKKIEGVWYQLGYVRRDMQILVLDCNNKRPELEIPPDTCIVAGTQLNVLIRGTDSNGDQVKIEVFSQILDPSPSFPFNATYSPVPGVNDYRTSPATTTFTWNTDCSHVRERLYQVVFKITDNPSSGPRLVTFKTWFIKVVGPPPLWTSANVNAPTRSVNLQWQPYFCQNAETIQVWRKVEGTDFTPECETGMPGYLGYELIQTLPARNNNAPVTSFLDNNNGQGLAEGAAYCYRLVAVYPLPNGGESLVSQDICVPPFRVDVPLVTKVSVLRTDKTNGQIRVEWTEPFEIDEVLFPPPHNFTYTVTRGAGFTRTGATVDRASNITDRFFVDDGINTEQEVYNYSITVFDNNNLVGTSAVASSVRLETQSQFQRIQLTWSASVPWSNQIKDFPNHIIYRGPENATDDQLVQIATVNVNANGFIFLDQGPLVENQVYCYKVETFGGYGNDNPNIPVPLRNFSQRICTLPGDTIPPCAPFVIVQPDLKSCEEYFAEGNCSNNVFRNRLTWERPDDVCGNDIAYYNIYVSNSTTGSFDLYVSDIRRTEFIDENLPSSFARCYAITAVDRTLNESALSEPICFENCPYYELPNVFSPNGDGCNDVFSAYREFLVGETQTSQCINNLDDIRRRCPRFVREVIFKVYNRWGKLVYSFSSSSPNPNEERSIYINWNGRDDNGRELSSGVYYYVAEVTFDMIDPSKRKKIFKSWVHLLRGEN